MKKIIVLAQFEAHVPDDITVEMIQDLAEEEIRDNYDSFRLYLPDYHDESEQNPWFELDDVYCGTNVSIAIGGN